MNTPAPMNDDLEYVRQDYAYAERLARVLMAGGPIPEGITLGAILAALKIIAEIIPIIDGLLPYFIRWWKQIFGTKEERQAVRAYKVLIEAKRILEEQEYARTGKTFPKEGI